MTAAVDYRVFLTQHARDQLERRDRVFWKERGVDGAVFEVYEAIRQGRIAKSMPREFTPGKRTSKKTKKLGVRARVVWTEDFSRCYALIASQHEGRPVWVIATVMTRWV